MPKRKLTVRTGFTVIELMVATVLAVIIVTGLGLILADSQRGWTNMYNRIYSDIVTDGYAARKRFDSVIRGASWEKYFVAADGTWIEVYYYADGTSTVLDRYARFFLGNGGTLNIEYGQLDPRTTTGVETICGNVTSCVFKADGRSAQMILMLDNGSQASTVVSSSVMHNQ
jgi:Tfp pilus assembly protein PilV